MTNTYSATEKHTEGYNDATGNKAMQSTDYNYRQGYYAGLSANIQGVAAEWAANRQAKS